MNYLFLGHDNLHMLRKEMTEVSLEVAFHHMLPLGGRWLAEHPLLHQLLIPLAHL